MRGKLIRLCIVHLVPKPTKSVNSIRVFQVLKRRGQEVASVDSFFFIQDSVPARVMEIGPKKEHQQTEDNHSSNRPKDDT
jgi:hypothetical protein